MFNHEVVSFWLEQASVILGTGFVSCSFLLLVCFAAPVAQGASIVVKQLLAVQWWHGQRILNA